MRDFRPPADPALDPLLERLAYLETVNDGLKSRLSSGGFGAELQNLALREQLESARAEIARQQAALESFYRETLAAGQARDLAQAAAEEAIKARESAFRERDAARTRVASLEESLELAKRGAIDPGAQDLVRRLEADLEQARRGARDAESALHAFTRKADDEAAQRLRALAAKFAESEAALLAAAEGGRRRAAAMEAELEQARRAEQDARSALHESSQKADAEAAERLQALAKEFAGRETARIGANEKDRGRIAEMERELERERLAARESERALREAHQKAQAEAEDRLQKLMKAFAERESLILKTNENDRRALAETAGELERARQGAREAERRAAEHGEREAGLLSAGESERRRREGLEFELARRDALEADRVFRESTRKSLPMVQAEAEERLRALKAEFAEREKNDRRRVAAMELELEESRRALETERAALELQRKSRQETEAETAQRLRTLGKEFAEREALLLKSSENERDLLAETAAELERTRRGAQEAQAQAEERLKTLAAEFAEREALLLKKAADDRALAAERLEEKAAPSGKPAVEPPVEEEPAAAEPFVSPALEPLLEPGWARLLRLVRPPVDSAYAHLRRLSATALTAGQQTLLRMAAASVASASDSLSSIELALKDGPAPGAASSVLPVLESSVAAWETAFRGRGVALAREFAAPLPEAAHDPEELRVVLHHALRNALEAVPRGGRLTLRAWRGPEKELRLEFADDGPGFPPKWLERRFEPFAAPRRGRAGLGLSLLRRTLRRWGGDAEAANGQSGRGARLTLIFAPPPPPQPGRK